MRTCWFCDAAGVVEINDLGPAGRVVGGLCSIHLREYQVWISTYLMVRQLARPT